MVLLYSLIWRLLLILNLDNVKRIEILRMTLFWRNQSHPVKHNNKMIFRMTKLPIKLKDFRILRIVKVLYRILYKVPLNNFTPYHLI
jgi:hypothetical protein